MFGILALLALTPVFASHDKTTVPATSGPDIETGTLSSPASSSGSGPVKPLDSLIILGVEPAPNPTQGQQFLQPDEAFRLSTQVLDRNTIIARWQIADSYYLYRNKFKFTLPETSGIRLKSVSLPSGEIKTDAYFGRVEVYFHETQALISLTRNTQEAADLELKVSYQGCTELGLCYPPITRKFSLTLPSALD